MIYLIAIINKIDDITSAHYVVKLSIKVPNTKETFHFLDDRLSPYDISNITTDFRVFPSRLGYMGMKTFRYQAKVFILFIFIKTIFLGQLLKRMHIYVFIC